MQTYTTPKDLTFTHVGDEPHIRKDGQQTTLRVWHAPCAHTGCQKPVVAKTTVGADPSKAGNFGRVHCDEHKLSKEAATAKWAAACKASNTKATEAVISEILQLRADGLSPSEIALFVSLSASRIYALLAKHSKP